LPLGWLPELRSRAGSQHVGGNVFEFLAALTAFLASHVIPARPHVRAWLAAQLGERPYIIGYSALSLALLAWLLSAAARAPFIPLWDVALWQYFIPIAVMLPALLLAAGSILCPNPLSISFSRRSFDSERPGIVAITRHPLLWAFTLWAFAHIVPNGDLVSVILFGGFGSFALLAMPITDRRKRRALGARWDELAQRTSMLPFAALVAGRARMRWHNAQLAGVLALGCGLYVALLWLHPWLFGPDPKIAFG
jgi:uncharacterized membrane protein